MAQEMTAEEMLLLENCPAENEYDSMPLEDRLFLKLRETVYYVRRAQDSMGGQKRVLSLLSRRGVMPQRELLEELGVKSGSLSEVLGKLESAGLVFRTPDESDRRNMNVTLTEQGREAGEQFRARESEQRARILSVLSTEEQEQLLLLLEKLNAGWI